MDESVTKQFERQQVGKLKLSQAIRVGAKLRPQCRTSLFMKGGSCVLGAAYEGATGKTTHASGYGVVTKTFPILGKDGELNEFGVSLYERRLLMMIGR